ncbi:MAG: hypothetical protein JWO36_784, partial [Myxococcales bacterium]|nr:hypothetical protein [Myxococcales bacterium]
GMLVFSRTNHWHGSPWHETIDDASHVITESSTTTPEQPVPDSIFLPAGALPSPLAITWSMTHGADLDWVPAPFTRSLRISDERTHYGTGYYIYHLYPAGADHLSTAIAPWHEEAPPDDVLAIFALAGTDIAPAGETTEATIDVPAGAAIQALELRGPAQIRRLTIDAPALDAVALAHVRLAITWDDRSTPSVDAPLGLLFAGGSLYNRDGRSNLVDGLLANVSFADGRIHMNLYLPMPFFASARIVIRGVGDPIRDVHVATTTLVDATPPNLEGYFHATYVDHATPTSGSDLILLDTAQTEGGGDWCGSFVGTSFTFSDRADLGTLEGDPRFFFDDARSPQAHGTGTEEWAGGGDYWGGQTGSLPLAGHPTGAPSLAAAQNADDAVESAYRFLIADAMPFGKNARIQLEHGAVDTSIEHYQTVTYWYGRPAACLVLTDTLHVGDAIDEQAHRYASPTASPPMMIASRWDGLGPDASDPVEVDTGRVMSEKSMLAVAIDPRNRGVLLRRKLDYALADQRAEVWIADDRDDASFVRVGVWYLAGSTTCIYSNPPGELDPGQTNVQAVDRRWKEDEFLVPRSVTEGRSAIRIQIRSVPNAIPLYPGAAPSPGGWSEVRYAVYSYVL